MSSQPQRRQKAAPRSGQEWAARLIQQAEAEAASRRSRDLCEAAMARGDAQIKYTWNHDSYQATFSVFARITDEIDVTAVELEVVDEQRPTAAQRVHWEQRFLDEVSCCGNLWLDLANAFWNGYPGTLSG